MILGQLINNDPWWLRDSSEITFDYYRFFVVKSINKYYILNYWEIDPPDKADEFTGEVMVVNTDDADDFCNISVSLTLEEDNIPPKNRKTF